jgi:hypothetical protein
MLIPSKLTLFFYRQSHNVFGITLTDNFQHQSVHCYWHSDNVTLGDQGKNV